MVPDHQVAGRSSAQATSSMAAEAGKIGVYRSAPPRPATSSATGYHAAVEAGVEEETLEDRGPNPLWEALERGLKPGGLEQLPGYP